MFTYSTCPDPTCPHQNAFGYCSLTACISRTITSQPVEMPECYSCEHVKDGDYLAHITGTDNGIVFEDIVAHYCPVCGRKLKVR